MLRRWTIRIVMLLAVACLAAGAVHADVMHLKNGRQISGTVVKEDDTSVTLEIGGQFKITIARDQIVRIDREDPVAVHLRQAKQHLASARFDRAATAYRKAWDAQPGSEAARDGYLEALNRWAAELLALKRYDECREVVAEIRRVSPDDPRIERVSALIDRAAADTTDLVKRGELLLNVADYDKAIEQFEAARRIMPERKQEFDRKLALAYAGQGDLLLKTGKLDAASNHYRQALELDPAIDRAYVARYVVTRVSLLIDELNKHDGPIGQQRAVQMAGQLQRLLELQPDSVHANYLYGLLSRSLGDREAARRAYRTVLAGQNVDEKEALDALQEMARKVSSRTAIAFKTEDEEKLVNRTLPDPMRELTHGNFVIRHRNEVVARRVALAADYHARRLFALFGAEKGDRLWPMPCTITLHPDKQSYVDVEKQPAWSPAVSRTRRIGDNLVELNLATYQQAAELIPCVIPHELTHLVIESIFPGQDVPLWLNEGLAVSQEQPYKKQHILAALMNHVRMKTDIPFDELVGRTTYPKPELVECYYAQSLVLTEVLMSRGDMHKLKAFVRRVQKKDLDRALRESFDMPLAELKRRYTTALTEVDRRLNRSVAQPVRD